MRDVRTLAASAPEGMGSAALGRFAAVFALGFECTARGCAPALTCPYSCPAGIQCVLNKDWRGLVTAFVQTGFVGTGPSSAALPDHSSRLEARLLRSCRHAHRVPRGHDGRVWQRLTRGDLRRASAPHTPPLPSPCSHPRARWERQATHLSPAAPLPHLSPAGHGGGARGAYGERAGRHLALRRALYGPLRHGQPVAHARAARRQPPPKPARAG